MLLTFNVQSQTLEWVRTSGGAGDDRGHAVTVDNDGNVYSTGYFSVQADLDPGAGIFTVNSNGIKDAFVTKYDSSGNFVWAKNFGGVNDDGGYGINSDGESSLYLTGTFKDTMILNIGFIQDTLISAGDFDCYIIKMDSSGNFIWAKTFGGLGYDIGKCIKVNQQNELVVTGIFSFNSNFNQVIGPNSLVSNGGNDVFIAKLDTSGNVIWSKSIGSASNDEGNSIAADHLGNLVVTGYINSTTDFDPGPGTFFLSSPSMVREVFVLKLDANGDFIWARRMGGNGWDIGNDIDVDAFGNVYTVGWHEGVNGSFSINPTNNDWGGGGPFDNVFISKLDLNGDFVWTRMIGGVSYSYNYGYAITLDNEGYVYVSGNLNSNSPPDLDPGEGVQSVGTHRGFLLRLDNGGQYVWSSNTYYGFDLTSDSMGSIYMTGLDFSNTTIHVSKYNTCFGSTTNSATTECDSLEWIDGFTYYESATLSHTFINSSGCDSIITLDLEIISSTSSSVTINVCDSYFWQGNNYTSSGIFYDTIPNAAGCDSMMTLNLTIRNSSSATFTIDECDSYFWQGNNYTSSGIFYDTIPNAVGCDSMMTLNLTIRNSSSAIFTIDECDSYFWQGDNYTSSGIYYDTIPNVVGCDSLMTLNLTIRNSSSASFTIDECDSYFWQGNNYILSGIFYDTIPNAVGCDSMMTLDLTIRNSSSASFTIDECDSYFWQGNNYTTSGIFYDTIPNAAGCDSMMTLNLTIRNSSSALFTIDECDSYLWQGTNYTSSGMYYDTIPNAAGCDSMMTLNLTIRNSSSASFTIDECDSYFWQGNNYTTSGIYYDTIPNAAGCDSNMTLNLTIRNSSNSLIEISACESYTWQGTTYDTTGIYVAVIPNAVGCDSNMTLDLTIYNAYYQNVYDSICEGDVYIFPNGEISETATIHTSIFYAVGGCDSIIYTTLTIGIIDTSVSENGVSFTANQGGAQYQWLLSYWSDCNNLIEINGATSQTFTPTAYGLYSVVITQNGCTDTSSCHLFEILENNIEDNSISDKLVIFPNPNEGIFKITGIENQEADVNIFNVIGERVFAKHLISTKGIFSIETNEIPIGLYFLKMQSGNIFYTKRFVVILAE